MERDIPQMKCLSASVRNLDGDGSAHEDMESACDPAGREPTGKILSYIAEKPLYNPDAARAVLEDFEATVERISQMGDRVPIGTHPIMRKRNLRRMNFQKHDYFVIYRVRGDIAEIVRIGHSLENLDKVLKCSFCPRPAASVPRSSTWLALAAAILLITKRRMGNND